MLKGNFHLVLREQISSTVTIGGVNRSRHLVIQKRGFLVKATLIDTHINRFLELNGLVNGDFIPIIL